MSDPNAVKAVLPEPKPHWVGDGFPVRSLFSVGSLDAAAISPFLLLDYAGPHDFPPSPDGAPRGVDQHPHRGFETVTILYEGELEHRDSTGAAGRLGPGDVQWMTAASGVVHEEKHSEAFTRRGGALEMIQLWVNLPASAKSAPPRYQDIRAESIPVVDLPGGAGTIRIIAGAHEGVRGPATTFTPIDVWDLTLTPTGSTTVQIPRDANTLLVVRRGEAAVGGKELTTRQVALLNNEGGSVDIAAGRPGAAILLLSGEPIDEPVVARGPFVMTTEDEIRQAMADYQSGRMGRLAPTGRGAS